ncbi:hypothetical protein [Saccharothrix obliqua]|uniref:hypothetical protein n=1 Tax=Saccharothrix obliqua TaxID=2861747 RepID=UPI0021512767|nr:hypothetical protein [Saccharothrix obliqua]
MGSGKRRERGPAARKARRAPKRVGLDAAVEWLTAAVAAAEPGDPDRVVLMADLGVAHQTRYEARGDLADLDRAVTAKAAALDAAPPDHPDRAVLLSNLGFSLLTRYRRGRAEEDLTRATEACEAAVAASPAGRPGRDRRLANLADCRHAWFERTGHLDDLRAALAAVTACSADPMRFADIGLLHLKAFEPAGAADDVHRAVGALESALAGLPADDPDRAAITAGLSQALLLRYRITHVPADLDRGVELGAEAAAGAGPDLPPWPAAVVEVHRARRGGGHPAELDPAGWEAATALHRVWFERTYDEHDRRLALDAATRGIERAPEGHPERPRLPAHLAFLHRAGYSHDGDPAHLGAAFDAARQAADTGLPEHLEALGDLHRVRYERTGDLADLHAAVALVGQALATAAPDHPDRASTATALSTAHRMRFHHTGAPEDVLIAVGTALTAAANGTAPPEPLNALGLAHVARFAHSADPDDLDRAVAAVRAAVDATPEGDPERPGRLSNLAIALHSRHTRTGDPKTCGRRSRRPPPRSTPGTTTARCSPTWPPSTSPATGSPATPVSWNGPSPPRSRPSPRALPGTPTAP